MLYAGAVAAGTFSSGAGVTVFGITVGYGFGAYIVMALAGTLGYLVGSLIGWAIGLYGGRPLLERHGRWFHITPENLARAEAWFGRWGNVGVAVGKGVHAEPVPEPSSRSRPACWRCRWRRTRC